MRLDACTKLIDRWHAAHRKNRVKNRWGRNKRDCDIDTMLGHEPAWRRCDTRSVLFASIGQWVINRLNKIKDGLSPDIRIAPCTKNTSHWNVMMRLRNAREVPRIHWVRRKLVYLCLRHWWRKRGRRIWGRHRSRLSACERNRGIRAIHCLVTLLGRCRFRVVGE